MGFVNLVFWVCFGLINLLLCVESCCLGDV